MVSRRGRSKNFGVRDQECLNVSHGHLKSEEIVMELCYVFRFKGSSWIIVLYCDVQQCSRQAASKLTGFSTLDRTDQDDIIKKRYQSDLTGIQSFKLPVNSGNVVDRLDYGSTMGR